MRSRSSSLFLISPVGLPPPFDDTRRPPPPHGRPGAIPPSRCNLSLFPSPSRALMAGIRTSTTTQPRHHLVDWPSLPFCLGAEAMVCDLRFCRVTITISQLPFYVLTLSKEDDDIIEAVRRPTHPTLGSPSCSKLQLGQMINSLRNSMGRRMWRLPRITKFF